MRINRHWSRNENGLWIPDSIPGGQRFFTGGVKRKFGAKRKDVGASSFSGSVAAEASGGDDYADLVLFWRCEGTTLGAGDTYGTDNTPVFESGAAINADAHYIGTNGLDLPTTSDRCYFDNNGEYVLNGAGVSQGRFGAWARITTWKENSAFLSAEDALADNIISFAQSGTDEVRLFIKTNNIDRKTLITTDANLSTGTWYFVECAWDIDNDYCEIFVDGVSKISDSATNLGAFSAALTKIYTGSASSAVASDFHMDNIMISTDKTRNLYLLKDLTSTPKP